MSESVEEWNRTIWNIPHEKFNIVPLANISSSRRGQTNRDGATFRCCESEASVEERGWEEEGEREEVITPVMKRARIFKLEWEVIAICFLKISDFADNVFILKLYMCATPISWNFRLGFFHWRREGLSEASVEEAKPERDKRGSFFCSTILMVTKYS